MERTQKRIMLIEPPFYRLYKDTYSLTRYSLSLGYLAATIDRDTDWTALVYNADFCPTNEQRKEGYMAGPGFRTYRRNLESLDRPIWREIEQAIVDFAPDVVGITTVAPKFLAALNIAKLAKNAGLADQTNLANRADPTNRAGPIVIAGGAYPSTSAEDVLSHPEFDIVVRGEGERTVVELLDALAGNRPLSSVKGIAYKADKNDGAQAEGGAQVIQTDDRGPIVDLDELPFPHTGASRLLKDYEKYPVSAFRYVFSARGCPYDCFFCGSKYVWGRRPRYRSTDNIVEEIGSLAAMGVRSIHFDDDTFGPNEKRLGELCGRLEADFPGLTWSCEAHARLINEASVARMKRAGCYAIAMGVESGSDRVLEKANKNLTIEQAKSACAVVKEHGIELRTFFVLGLPWETEESLAETRQAIDEIKADRYFMGLFAPYPGTDAYRYCESRGLIRDGHNPFLANHQSLEDTYLLDLSPDTFRRQALELLSRVDRENVRHAMKQVFSRNSLWRLRELGLRRGIARGLRVLTGR